MNLRENKWEIAALVGQTVSTISLAITYTGWARVLWVALGLFCVITWCREIRVQRRKRLERRQQWLKRLDLLMQREIRRRR